MYAAKIEPPSKWWHFNRWTWGIYAMVNDTTVRRIKGGRVRTQQEAAQKVIQHLYPKKGT